ncbi:MAG: hypothetical protein WBH40_09265 [Ignavibacteriaceae bacterium]|jgi:hypothetical protein
MPTRNYRRHKKPKSGLGNWLKYRFATEFDQNIQALVYFGAAFLVIIVGLRGLGDLSDVSFIPHFLLDSNGKIDAHIVMVGLVVEFLMLCLLAAVSFFAPSESRPDLQTSIESLSKSVEKLSETIPSELVQKMITSAQETAKASEKLLIEEIEILNNFRSRLDERIRQMDQDIILVRQSIAQGIIDSSAKMEEVVKKEQETLGSYNKVIEALIAGTKETLNKVSQSISNEVKKTFATSAAVMTRQEKMIVKFYGINSKLLSEAQENFKKYILNYSEMVDKESQRLEWISTKQIRPEEFILNINKTNERLISHLENIDNSLKIITNGRGSSYDGIVRKKSFWGWMGRKGRRQLDKIH